MVHREELVIQAVEKVNAIANCPVGIIKAGHRMNLDAPIQVASVQSMANRLSLLESPGLIVVDEAHHSTATRYTKILEACPGAYQLGVTATPIRLDGSGFEGLFDEIVSGISVSELIQQGYLSKFKLFADPNPMTTKGVRTISGDYSSSDIAEANNILELSGNVVSSYRIHADGKRCVVFAVNFEHSMARTPC